MDNIVIDTNSLIMAISSRSDYHKIWQSFLDGDYYMCISNEILEEYAEVIARNISVVLKEIPFPSVEVINIDDFLKELH